jgi:hypothetical protein
VIIGVTIIKVTRFHQVIGITECQLCPTELRDGVHGEHQSRAAHCAIR